MAKTTLRGTQITDGTVQRADLDTTTSSSAVVAKIVQGTGISLSSTGVDSGTGDVTVSINAAYSGSPNTPRVTSISSSSTPTPVASTDDVYIVTALAASATFASPGAGNEGQPLLIRIKDNGTARTLFWNAIYRASSDLSLPSTTILSKTLYLRFIYNTTDSKWDLLALLNNF